ncbi:MAG TPA: mechanosensitive ion channel family protein [Thermoplasmata archaeon]|nr:mechanosensitive ion channel family protein [Thermoplasmata archaeon]
MPPEPEDGHPLRTLIRNLVLVVILAVGLFVFFVVFNKRFLSPLNDTEVLLLEAGAVLLVAWATARAFTSAANEVLRRRSQIQHGATIRIFLNLIIGVVAILALFHLAGVDTESIFLGSAFAGIVLGLAAQTVLANVFAGLLIVMASPFRPGDRVSFISSSYGAFPPSYPHEMVYPHYAGVVVDVELLYTILRLDSGGTAKLPNSVVLGALVLQPNPGVPRAHRVRMTFPLATPVKSVEAALPDVAAAFPTDSARAPPQFEVADISAATWDAVIVLWSPILDEGLVRDRVMRAVLGRVGPTPPVPAR